MNLTLTEAQEAELLSIPVRRLSDDPEAATTFGDIFAHVLLVFLVLRAVEMQRSGVK